MEKWNDTIWENVNNKTAAIPPSSWRLISNWVIPEAFKGNEEAIARIIWAVTGKWTKIKEIQTEVSVNLGQESSEARFDILAIDEDDHYYGIEFQDYDQRNIRIRSSYYCSAVSMLKTKGLSPQYSNHHETTIIFFCTNSIEGANKGVLRFHEKDTYGRKVMTPRDCYIIAMNDLNPNSALGKLAQDLCRCDGRYIYKELQNAYNRIDQTRRPHMSEEEKKIFDEANEEARLYGVNEGEEIGIEKTRAAFIKGMRAEGVDEATIKRVLAATTAHI